MNKPQTDLNIDTLLSVRDSQKPLLCIDYGQKRIGIALSDRRWKIASFHSMIPNDGLENVARKIKKIADDYQAFIWVVGYPLHMDGSLSPMAQSCLDFSRNLLEKFPDVTIFMQDERLSSSEAESRLAELGATNKQRKLKVDKIAAEVILKRFLIRTTQTLTEHLLARDQNEIKEILNFWFQELDESQWFLKSNSLDAFMKSRFNLHLQALIQNKKEHWLESASSTLAYILLADQFTRNCYRGDAIVYEDYDPKALSACKIALKRGFDRQLNLREKRFLFMPLMHSESLEDQDLAVNYFQDIPDSFNHALQHRDVIVKFGRFPHRNAILNRASTNAEQDYLKSPDAFRG